MACSRAAFLAACLLSTDLAGAFQLTATLGSELRSEPGSESARLPCIWGPKAYYQGRSGRAMAVWNLALEEASLEADDVSTYACNVPKVPWSWVQRVQAMNHTKAHNYNFQGSVMFALVHQKMGDPRPQYTARNWVLDFAQENFTEDDVLRISDVTAGYTPMGPYDKSQTGGYDAHHPMLHSEGSDGDRNDHTEYFETFDAEYFETMAQSNFTLSAGGDRPWSMRFYEAIMSGSIPIVASKRLDIGAPDMWALWQIPYKFYLRDSGEPFVYRQDWVDHNMELFIKYQTFHDGDNAPSAS